MGVVSCPATARAAEPLWDGESGGGWVPCRGLLGSGAGFEVPDHEGAVPMQRRELHAYFRASLLCLLSDRLLLRCLLPMMLSHLVAPLGVSSLGLALVLRAVWLMAGRGNIWELGS